MGTGGKEEQGASEGNMEENGRESERRKMGFATWARAVNAAEDRVEWKEQVKGPILPEEK